MLGLGKKHDKGTWYHNWRKHPAKTIYDKRWDKKTKQWVPQRNHGTIISGICADYPLTSLQTEYNVYEPIVAYRERWNHEEDKQGNFISAEPIPGTREQHDLPPLYVQWKQDWQRRFLNG